MVDHPRRAANDPQDVVQRLTKGQLPNFYGGLGQRIMEELFPGSHPAIIPEVPGRRVDLLDPVTRVVREIKTGGFALSTPIKEQIANDVKLIQAGYKVEWWNLQNPVSARQWMTPELIRALQDAGITVVSHIKP